MQAILLREFCRIAPDSNRAEVSYESDVGCNTLRLLQEFSILTEAEAVVNCSLGVFKNPGHEEPIVPVFLSTLCCWLAG